MNDVADHRAIAGRPRADAAFELPGGRRLAYAIYGAEHGRPVVFCHGFPGSRYHGALVDGAARDAGVAVIAFDRPGLGRSTFAPGHALDDVAEDAGRLADRLGHDRFEVVGASCGGPYALACARRWPDRVRAVGLLAGIGPAAPRALRRGQLPVLQALFALGRIHPRLATPLLAIDRRVFLADAERAVSSLARLLTAPDRALLDRDAHARRVFAVGLAEAYRPGLDGVRSDLGRVARLDDSMFDGVSVPVHVYQGQHDRHVPPATGRYVASRIPGSELHPCPDDGHLSVVVTQFADCVRRLHASEELSHA